MCLYLVLLTYNEQFNEQLDFTHTANTLAAAGSRALGGILHKYFKINGMQFKVFKKLFDTCVIPVLNYGSELWGYKCYQKLETVLYTFLNVYLGLTITAPTAMILGDSGIYPLRIMRKVNIISMFYKLSHHPEDRLLNKVVLYDHGHSLRGTCCHDVKAILDECDMSPVYFDWSNWSRSALLDTVRERLHALYQETWSNELIHTSKLSTYKDIKHVFSPETYMYVTIPFLNRRQRRTIVMCRSGTLSLEIERGRWRGIHLENNAYVVSAILVKWRMWYTYSDAKNINKYDMICILTIITV